MKYPIKVFQQQLNSFSRFLNSVRIFKITIFFFNMVPILFISYLYIMSLQVSQPIFHPVKEEPIMTIMFVIAMLNPFFGLLTKVVFTDLLYDSYIKFSLLELRMLVISLIMIGNIFGSIALMVCMHKVRKENQLLINSSVLDWKTKGIRIRLAGNIVIMFLSVLCFFFLIRIQFY